MREPLLAPRPDLVVYTVGAFLSYPGPRFSSIHVEILDAIDLVEHEHRRFPIVQLGGACSVRNLRAVGRSPRPLLGGRNDQGGPGETHPLAPLGRGPRLAGRGPYRTVVTCH